MKFLSSGHPARLYKRFRCTAAYLYKTDMFYQLAPPFPDIIRMDIILFATMKHLLPQTIQKLIISALILTTISAQAS